MWRLPHDLWRRPAGLGFRSALDGVSSSLPPPTGRASMRTRPLAVAMLIGILAVACREAPPCARCDTLVIAATGEPHALLPPPVGGAGGGGRGGPLFCARAHP